MIFEGQTFIHETIRQLHQKLDEVMGRQEITLSQVNALQRQGGMAGGAGVPPQQQQHQQVRLNHIINFFQCTFISFLLGDW